MFLFFLLHVSHAPLLVLNSEMAAMLAGEYNCEVVLDRIEGEDLTTR
jgi:hypothetical protein